MSGSRTACAPREPHTTIRRANKISSKTNFRHLEIEDWCQAGFFVHYDNDQVAEVSWAFIRAFKISPIIFGSM
jgi:hypothetical protein